MLNDFGVCIFMWSILLNIYNTNIVIVSIHKWEEPQKSSLIANNTSRKHEQTTLQKSSMKVFYVLVDLDYEPIFVCEIECLSTISWKSFSYCSHLGDFTMVSAYPTQGNFAPLGQNIC